MDTDSRGLLFFIFGFTCIWLVFDEFYGKKRISNLTNLLTPTIPSLGSVVGKAWNNQPQAQKDKEAAKQKVDQDPKLNQKEKDYLKENIDHFYGQGPA